MRNESGVFQNGSNSSSAQIDTVVNTAAPSRTASFIGKKDDETPSATTFNEETAFATGLRVGLTSAT